MGSYGSIIRMGDEKENNRKIGDMKGYDSQVNVKDQYSIRSDTGFGRKTYPD